MPQRPKSQEPVVPIRYAGQWIAWDRTQTKIVANGRSLAETKQRAEAAGVSEPVFAKVPKADVRFAGGSA